MTLKEQKEALNLLKRGLALKERFDNGDAVSMDADDRHTNDVRKFLIKHGALPDRRKK